MLPPELAQQQNALNQLNLNQQPPMQESSQMNMHLLNIAIACEMQRQQSLNQQISILSSLLQQLQLH